MRKILPDFDFSETLNKSSYIQQNVSDILSILETSYYCLDFVIRLLVHGPRGCGKRLLAKTASSKLNMKFCEANVNDLLDENVVGTDKKIRAFFSKYATPSRPPTLIYLSTYELFCTMDQSDLEHIEQVIEEELNALLRASKQSLVFIAATSDFTRVYNSGLSSAFQHDISLIPPDSAQTDQLISLVVSEANLESDPKRSLELARKPYYIGNIVSGIVQSELECYKLKCQHDIDLVKDLNNQNSGVRWDDVGGLADVKQEVIDTIKISIKDSRSNKSGLKRTGILLYGPPGTGKTLLARAIATECGLNFINVKGPELLNEYVGQSEFNIRNIFEKARDASPSVIFFDELDSLAPNRGQAGDSGGVMDRMVSQILAEMDGVAKKGDIFVIGATNRVDLVDPSLLRPGRFDRVLEVPLPKTRENRLQILKALTRKMQLSEDVDLEKLEKLSPGGMSGADFQGLCSSAVHRAIDRCLELIEKNLASESEVEIRTEMQDFSAVLNTLNFKTKT